MEKTKALLNVTLLVALPVGSEAGKESKPKEEVYNPKGFDGFGGYGFGLNHGFGPFWGLDMDLGGHFILGSVEDGVPEASTGLRMLPRAMARKETFLIVEVMLDI